MQKNGLIASDTLVAVADYVSLSLLAILFFPVLLFTIELYTQTTGEIKWLLPVAVAIAMPVVYLKFIEDKPPIAQCVAVILLAATLAKAFTVAGLFYDDSSDGMAYHADGILLLLKGINPIYQWMHGFDDIWTNHYPKALWYFASIVIHLTGNYNIGKSYNVLLIAAAFFYSFSVMTRRELSFGNALLAALAVSLNPVAISQFNSFYVDGALASLMTLATFSILMMLGPSSAIDKAVFFMAGCLLINVKFTGVAYLFVIYVVASAALLWKNYTKPRVRTLVPETHVKTLIAPMLAVVLMGGLVMGFNPYIQNIVREGNPFFPLFGNNGGRDVIAAQSPPSFNENHTPLIGKLLLSIFSKSENVIYQHGTAEPQLKMPFSVGNDELKVFMYNDVRIAGWGVLFGGTLLLSIMLYMLSSSWKEENIAIALLFIIGTILINPGSWWARYAPQVALLPLLMALPSLASAERWHRITAKFILVLMIFNSALILPVNVAYMYETTHNIHRQIKDIVKTCGPGVYQISGTNGYHYEQLFWNKGIILDYVNQDLRKTHRQNELFPLLTSVADAVLYKKGCGRTASRH